MLAVRTRRTKAKRGTGYRLVIDTLKDVKTKQPDRKCFRLVGGVLVERTVKEVLPALEQNRENVSLVRPVRPRQGWLLSVPSLPCRSGR
jgi:chaperonin cofactor prefoldin